MIAPCTVIFVSSRTEGRSTGPLAVPAQRLGIAKAIDACLPMLIGHRLSKLICPSQLMELPNDGIPRRPHELPAGNYPNVVGHLSRASTNPVGARL